MLKFDRTVLARKLEGLPHPARVAFAASAATRLFPTYNQYCEATGFGDAAGLREALYGVWEYVEGSGRHPAELRRLEGLAESLTDVVEAPQVQLFVGAQNATAAVTYCLRAAVSEGGEDAALAAEQAWNEAYQIALFSRVSGTEVDAPGMIERDEAHPWVQAELARQNRDLEELRFANPAQLAGVVARLGARSQNECVVPVNKEEERS